MSHEQKRTVGKRNATATRYTRFEAAGIRSVEGEKEKDVYELSFSSETSRVMRYDWRTGEIIPEILVHDEKNVDLSPIRDAGSILRNHDANQIVGYPVTVQISNTEGRGRATMRFGTTARAKEAKQEVDDKTLRGVSFGYDYNDDRADNTIRLKAGETWTSANGRTFTGPALLVLRWSVHEITLTPVPADAGVGIDRAAGGDSKNMNEAFIRALCRAAGLDEAATLRIIAKKLADEAALQAEIASERAAVSSPAPDAGKKKKSKKAARAEDAEDDDEEDDEEDETERARKDGETRERKRVTSIRAICAAARMPEDFVRKHIDEGTGLEALGVAIAERQKAMESAGLSTGVRAEVGLEQNEKHLRFLTVNLGRRAASGIVSAEKYEDETTKGVERANVRLSDVIRAGLEMDGVPGARYMSPQEAGIAFFEAIRGRMPKRAVGNMHVRAANVSGDLANALSNLQNKAMMLGFKMADPTWRYICRKTTLNDFKINSRVQLSEWAQLRETGENGEILDSKLSDGVENIQALLYARKVSLTLQMIINDDMDALGRLPSMLGKSAAVLPSRLCYTTLLANGVMRDGVALYHASHNNLYTGGGSALAAAGLNQALGGFRKQTAPQAPNDSEFAAEPIDVNPAILLVPPELEYTANSLVRPNLFVTDNKYFDGKLTPIVESRLSNASYSGSSATAWYLFANPTDADTLEMGFLDGNESPNTMAWEDFDSLSLKYRAWVACGVKPMDWRATNKSNGA